MTTPRKPTKPGTTSNEPGKKNRFTIRKEAREKAGKIVQEQKEKEVKITNDLQDLKTERSKVKTLEDIAANKTRTPGSPKKEYDATTSRQTAGRVAIKARRKETTIDKKMQNLDKHSIHSESVRAQQEAEAAKLRSQQADVNAAYDRDIAFQLDQRKKYAGQDLESGDIDEATASEMAGAAQRFNEQSDVSIQAAADARSEASRTRVIAEEFDAASKTKIALAPLAALVEIISKSMKSTNREERVSFIHMQTGFEDWEKTKFMNAVSQPKDRESIIARTPKLLSSLQNYILNHLDDTKLMKRIEDKILLDQEKLAFREWISAVKNAKEHKIIQAESASLDPLDKLNEILNPMPLAYTVETNALRAFEAATILLNSNTQLDKVELSAIREYLLKEFNDGTQSLTDRIRFREKPEEEFTYRPVLVKLEKEKNDVLEKIDGLLKKAESVSTNRAEASEPIAIPDSKRSTQTTTTTTGGLIRRGLGSTDRTPINIPEPPAVQVTTDASKDKVTSTPAPKPTRIIRDQAAQNPQVQPSRPKR